MNSNLFRFFVSGNKDRIVPESELWKMPLSGKSTPFSTPSKKVSSPLSAKPNHPNKSDSITFGAVTIGDYLSTCRKFLLLDGCHHLKLGLKFLLGENIATNQFKRIDLYLEKHGAFYHPVKVIVSIKTGQVATLVVNGAVSTQGLAIIENEYSILSNLYHKPGLRCKPFLNNYSDLNKKTASFYLPAVFGVKILTESKGKFGFFLGEWFDGFKEFHITETKESEQVVVWSGDGTNEYISLAESLPIYQKISKILTHYYNLETFEQIFPWHHAAGDFVIKHDEDELHVRLITIRDYISLLEFETEPESSNTMILPGLLMFFLNLSLKIRLDRLDGTGKMVFLDRRVLDFSIQGFLQGLDEKTSIYDYGDIDKAFIEFIQQFDQNQLKEMIENLMDSNYHDPSELQLIESHLKSHCQQIYSNFQSL